MNTNKQGKVQTGGTSSRGTNQDRSNGFSLKDRVKVTAKTKQVPVKRKLITIAQALAEANTPAYVPKVQAEELENAIKRFEQEHTRKPMTQEEFNRLPTADAKLDACLEVAGRICDTLNIPRNPPSFHQRGSKKQNGTSNNHPSSVGQDRHPVQQAREGGAEGPPPWDEANAEPGFGHNPVGSEPRSARSAHRTDGPGTHVHTKAGVGRVQDAPAEPSTDRENATRLAYPCKYCSDGYLVLRNSVYGKFYGCQNWPQCSSTMSAHQQGNYLPMSSQADGETKKARSALHRVYDRYWMGYDGDTNRLRRTRLYEMVSEHLGVKEFHIGFAELDQIDKVNKYLADNDEHIKAELKKFVPAKVKR